MIQTNRIRCTECSSGLTAVLSGGGFIESIDERSQILSLREEKKRISFPGGLYLFLKEAEEMRGNMVMVTQRANKAMTPKPIM